MTNRPTILELERLVCIAKIDAARQRRLVDAASRVADFLDEALADAEAALSREQDRIDTEHLDALDAADREQDAV